LDKHQLKTIIKELKKWSAPATVLLSLYVPPTRSISDIVSMLRQEMSIAENIKLKRTRDAVQYALTSAIERLSSLTKVPENGLVVFCGEDVEKGDNICFMFSPPEKVNVYFYRTDKTFHVEFLEPMIEEEEVYGIIIIERDQATIGLLKGFRVTLLKEMEGYIPGKHHKGGQSQRRYDRIIDELIHDFMKSVGEAANTFFLPVLEKGKLKGIILGGAGLAKKDFYEGDYLDYRLKKLILEPLLDVSYQGDAGLREAVNKASDLLKDHKLTVVNKVIEEIKYHLAKGDDLVIYGYNYIEKALDMGAIEKLVIDEDSEWATKLSEKAKKSGAQIYYINEELGEAEWIRKTFNGAIGILRYKIYIEP
jgi:peptide chain release factor subunit 1